MKKIISCMALTILLYACKKTELAIQPGQETINTSTENNLNKNLTVTTYPVNVNSAIQAFILGEISVTGGGNSLKENGFCYNTTPNPTIYNDTVHGAPYFWNTDMYEALIEGLTPGTTYYVKAFGIKNNGDVYYGNEISFTTLTIGSPGPGVGTVTDIDGNVYHTITLGTQVWMVENLKATRFRDGTSIPNVPDNTAWSTATSGAYCDYNNIPANAADYGRLYNLYAIKDSRHIAPTGWHIPNFSEWVTALNYLGGVGIAGGRMKEAGFVHWDSPNTGADNSSWFTAMGAGFRVLSSMAPFVALKTKAVFWSSSSNYTSPSFPYINSIILDYNSASWSYQSGSIGGGTSYGYAVRCVKDN